MAWGLAAAVAFATPALAGHDSSSKSNKFLSTFVRACNECTGNTRTHNPPLAFNARTPVTFSPAPSFGPKDFGQAKGVVVWSTRRSSRPT